MRFFTDDPAADFLRHDREQERKKERLPRCEGSKCGKYIDEDYYYFIEGEILCEKCMNRRYRRAVEIE